MSLLNDLSLQAIMSRLAAGLLYAAFQGGLLTLLIALLRREEGEKGDRFSFNPLDHISMPGMAMAVLFRTTWIRYHAPQPESLKGGRLALVGIALAVLAASLALVPLLDGVRQLIATYVPRTAGYAMLQVAVALQEIILMSVPLNLLPLPGLIGGLFLFAALPERARQWRRLVVPVNVVLVLALVAGFVPNMGPMLAPYFSRL